MYKVAPNLFSNFLLDFGFLVPPHLLEEFSPAICWSCPREVPKFHENYYTSKMIP